MDRITNLTLGGSCPQSAQIWTLNGYEDRDDFAKRQQMETRRTEPRDKMLGIKEKMEDMGLMVG